IVLVPVVTSPLSSLTLRRPPSPTLFPYTTLFRSCEHQRQSDLCAGRCPEGQSVRHGLADLDATLFSFLCRRQQRPERRLCARGRSEEHTSELQSLAYLVCRLLLEKKKRPDL